MYFIIMENIDLYTIKQNLKTILCVQSRYIDNVLKSLYLRQTYYYLFIYYFFNIVTLSKMVMI